jgi:hypothetical protein
LNLPNAIRDGAEAESLLRHPTFVRAVSNVRQAIHERWESSPISDTQGQHELRLMLKLLTDIQTVLEVAVSDGNEARRELDRLNSKVISPSQWMNR